MAALTGMSLRTYQRLENGEVDNPPLRYLVNCAIVFGVDWLELVEDEWLEWMPIDPRLTDPPKAPWRPAR